MTLIAESLAYVTEHLGGQRCEVVRNQALSSQLFIERLSIAVNPGGNGRLLNLRMRFAAGILDQVFERVWTYSQNRALPHLLSLAAVDGSFLWFHVHFEAIRQMLVLAWHWHLQDDGWLCLKLERIFHLGQCERDPLDLCRDHLVYLENALLKCGHQPLSLGMDVSQFEIRLQMTEWIMKLMVASENRRVPLIACGKTSVQLDSEALWFDYQADEIEQPLEKIGAQAEGISLSGLAMPEVTAFAQSGSNGCYRKNIAQNAAKILGDAEGYGAVRRLHECVGNKDLNSSLVLEALEEAEKTLPHAVYVALLYMVYVWGPEFSDDIKLQVLGLASSEHASALVLKMLADIYRREQSDTLVLALLQRQMNVSTFCPHRLIRLGLETVETLSGSLMMYSLAVRRLDAMKSLVLQHGSIRELIAFALAYHHAQYSGMAIQCLKQWMKQATRGGDIAAFGYHLAQVMLEHNEPMQKIMDVCTQVLEVEPTHGATLEILAQCLEDSDRPEEAAETWHYCFGFLLHAWELARTRYGAMPTAENGHILAQSHGRAVRTAQTLERLLDGMERAPQRCLIYREHLRLEPNAVHVLARYLKDLESMRYFHEMAQCCEDFLGTNGANLSVNDEISIRLTLHNIYDRELHRETDALKHLTRAQQIGALDPRVISAEIDRCRRRGQKKEQMTLMMALIDALPASECVEPTLEYVRLCESVHADVGMIVEVLRKTNARYPNQLPILLELRHYLRKTGQTFELAAVLEKLAKVTTDLQTRRSILLEASEIQEKLGNHKLAQNLYDEAQLCSPINPVGKADMPQTLRLGYGDMHTELPKADHISRLASVVLTSRSVSAVNEMPDEAFWGMHTSPGLGGLHPMPFVDVSQSAGSLSDWLSVPSSALSLLTSSVEDPAENAVSEELVHTTGEDVFSDSQRPVEEQIMAARLHGNTQALLNKLLRVIDQMPESEQPPRVLQEIGCIYLYDEHDVNTAQKYLERACKLSHEVAHGEQTLNALELIYQSLKRYRELAEVYQKKCEILTIAEEKRRYEIRLAQIRYEHLKETELAIHTLKRMLAHYPANESALQLLAQIYIETHQIDDAVETLEQITGLLKPNSKALAQHLLRLSGIYMEHDKRDAAKRTLRMMLRQREHIDKLAVLEQYKGICRAHDEWHELLSLLREELAFHLQLDPETTCIESMLASYHSKPMSGHASHTLREYADVLFYKLHDIEKSLDIYGLLLCINPDDEYCINVLTEILEQTLEPYSWIEKVWHLVLDNSESKNLDSIFCTALSQAWHVLAETREKEDIEAWQHQLEAIKKQVKETRYAKLFAVLLNGLGLRTSLQEIPMGSDNKRSEA